MIVFLIIFLSLLILISGCFSASESALFSLNSIKVKTFKQDSDNRKKLVAQLLKHPQDLLTTLIIINIFINILVQNVVASIFGDVSGWFVNVIVPLGITLIFGEIVPKSLGLAHNEAIAVRAAPFLSRAQIMLSFMRRALKGVASNVSRVLFGFLKKEENISLDELKYALDTSKQSGVLSQDEADIAKGYLTLQQAQVKDVMRPRDEILFYDINTPLEELVKLFVDNECTRVPVCRGHLDQFLGVITSDVFFIHKQSIPSRNELSQFYVKPLFAPESMQAEDLLNRMYDKKESFALVVDEYGAVSGLITLEDMVEIVIGEISDRKDQKERYSQSSPDSIIASGKLELVEFESIFNIPLSSNHHMVTLGGWLTEKLGDIPKVGAQFKTDKLSFQVIAADAKRIKRIYIRKLNSVVEELLEDDE
jgi:CBS domain containing-hemolysin-like protein